MRQTTLGSDGSDSACTDVADSCPLILAQLYEPLWQVRRLLCQHTRADREQDCRGLKIELAQDGRRLAA